MANRDDGRYILMLLTNRFDPDPRVYYEARALLEQGYRVTVVCWDRDLPRAAADVTIDDISVHRISLASRHGRGNSQLLFVPLFWLRALWYCLRKQYDYVHCHDFDTLPLGFVLGRIRRKPVIYDSHENYLGMLGTRIHPWIRRMLRAVEDFLLRRVELVITVGDRLREHFEKRGAGPCVVVGNWKPLEDYQRPAGEIQEIRRRLGIPKGAFCIAFIGNLDANRKLAELLEAVKHAEFPVHLLIGGKGALADSIVEASRTNQRIKYLGFVNVHDIPAYTLAADVIFYGMDKRRANAWAAIPNKLFEAIAAGRPMIAADCGEMGDIIRRYGCGLLLEEVTVNSVGNALAECRRREQWQRLAYGAVSAAKEYNWKRAKDRLVHCYLSLAAPPVIKAKDRGSAFGSAEANYHL